MAGKREISRARLVKKQGICYTRYTYTRRDADNGYSSWRYFDDEKGHPCGSKDWEVLRVGMDFRLKCMGCGHMIMIPRSKAEKNIRRIVHADGTEGEK